MWILSYMWLLVGLIIACLLPIYAIVHSYRNAKNKKNLEGVWDFFYSLENLEGIIRGY